MEGILGKIVAGQQGGEEVQVTVGKVVDRAVKEGKMLLENTEEAFQQGAFGLPWMVCENEKGQKEGFWGLNHLGVRLDFLGIEKPRTRPWKALL